MAQTLQEQAKLWAGRFITLKRELFQARGNVEQLSKAAPNDPEIQTLARHQRKLEARFFTVEGKVLSLAQKLGYEVPGLASLEFAPFEAAGVLIEAAKLYADASRHIQEVAARTLERRGGQTIPASSAGISWWLPLAGAALVILIYMRR